MRATVVLCVAVLVLAACGGGSAHAETAGEAAQRQYEMMGKGQYGLVYDTELHPAVQAAHPRDEWLASTGKSIFSIRKVRVITTYDEPFTFPDGSRTVTAVTLGITSGIGALPTAGAEQTITVHEELIAGKWRLFMN